MKKLFGWVPALIVVLVLAFTFAGCDYKEPETATGIKKATANVKVDPTTGMTVEQKNVARRLETDNEPGSIKHLYAISVYSGQVMLYSTVKGKVTSSGKRLTPSSVSGNYDSPSSGFDVKIGSSTCVTQEVMNDDGTYSGADSGGSYIYWWDTNDRYRQLFLNGNMMIVVSSVPLPVKSITINLEQVNE